MKFRRSLGLVAVLAAEAACSSSSSPKAASPPAEAGTVDDSGVGPITELNDGATMAVPPITCGGASCSAPSGGVVPLSPCCLPNGGCGANFGAAALAMYDAGGIDAAAAAAICLDTSAGTLDPTCPSEALSGMTFKGCCAVSGVCGVDLSIASLGCNSLSAFGALAPGDGSVSAPQACTAGLPDGGVSGDGGGSLDGSGAHDGEAE